MLEALIEVSRRYGTDSAFVLAGGGNTSFKQDDRLWVKASGHALATISEDGFVELDRRHLDRMLHDEWPEDPKEREALFVQRVMAARVHPERNQRPSVEALLHHLLPDGLVVHTHPGSINALTCCVNGPALANQWLGNDVLWQPYVDPGSTLAQALADRLAAHQQQHGVSPKAILLANHGFIVAGNSPAAIDETTASVVRQIQQRTSSATVMEFAVRDDLVERYQAAMDCLAPDQSVASDRSAAIQWLVTTAEGKSAALAGALTPDQIVYCRSFPVWLEPADEPEIQIREAIEEYEKSDGFMPWVFLIAGVGMIAMRESAKLAGITRDVFVDAAVVSRKAHQLGGVLSLGPDQRRFIEDWEVEAYRRSIAAATSK